jgi:transcriptional regulator with XRE-family HTH domain
MAEIAHPIKIDLPTKLQDREYRQKYFLAESSAQLAEQIAALRKRRDLNQTQLAEMIGTKQPAISRVEQADYQNWNFGTVQRIVGALDGRLRVIIQASEDVLPEYEQETSPEEAPYSQTINALAFSNIVGLLNVGPSATDYQCGVYVFGNQPNQGLLPKMNVVNVLAQKDAEIARLEKEVAELKRKKPTVVPPINASDYQAGSIAQMLTPVEFLSSQPAVSNT